MNDKMYDKSSKGGNSSHSSNHSNNHGCSNGPVQSETLTLIKQQFFKTKMCPFQKNKNFCLNESNCHYAHSLDELKPMPNLRNTKLCDYIKRKLPCQNINCKFAHDIEALKPSVHLATYKSAICSFWGKGKCFNGDKCRFAHGDADMNKTEDLTKLDTFKNEMKNKNKIASSGNYQCDNNCSNNNNNNNNNNNSNSKNNSSNNNKIHDSRSGCTDTNYGTKTSGSNNDITDNNNNNSDTCNNNCKNSNRCNSINTGINKCNSSEQILFNNNTDIQENETNSLQKNVQNNSNNNNNDMNQYTASTQSINTCDEGMNYSVENTNVFFFDKSKDSFLKKGNPNIANTNYTICKTISHSNGFISDNNNNNTNTIISGATCSIATTTNNNDDNNNNNNDNTFSNNGNRITMSSKSQLDHFDNLDIDIDRTSEFSHYLHQNVTNNLHNINRGMEINKQETISNDFIFEEHKKYGLYSDSIKDIIEKIEKMSLSNNREKNDKYTQMIKYLVHENMRLKENLRQEYIDPLMMDTRQNKKPFSFESTNSTENSKLSNSTDLSKFLICNDDNTCATSKTTHFKNSDYKNIHPINAPTFEDPNKVDDNFSSIIKTIDDILISHNVDSFADIRDDQMEFGNDFHMDQDTCKELFVLNNANNNDVYKNYENLINNMKSYDAIKNDPFDCNQFIPLQKNINTNPIINNNHINNKNIGNDGSSTHLHVDNFSVNENVREKPNVELLEQLFQQSLLHEQLEKKRNAFIGDPSNGNNFHFDAFLQKKTLIPNNMQSKEMNDTLQKKKITPLLFFNSPSYVSPNTEAKHLQKIQLQQNKKADFSFNQSIRDVHQETYPFSKNNINLALNLNNNDIITPYQQTQNYQITKNVFKERNTKLNIPEQSPLNDNINLNLEKIIEMSNGKSDILKKLKDFISNELQQISDSNNNNNNNNTNNSSNNNMNINKYSSNTKIINFSNNIEANENTNHSFFNEPQNNISYTANKNITFPNFYRNDTLYPGTLNSTHNPLITDIPSDTTYSLGFMPNNNSIFSGIEANGNKKHQNKLTSISSMHPTNIRSINEKNIWNSDNTSLHSINYTRPSFANDWINNKTNDFFNISKSINLGSLH